mgnify:CR=1 FL=1|jgi:hypothetical protein
MVFFQKTIIHDYTAPYPKTPEISLPQFSKNILVKSKNFKNHICKIYNTLIQRSSLSHFSK